MSIVTLCFMAVFLVALTFTVPLIIIFNKGRRRIQFVILKNKIRRYLKMIADGTISNEERKSFLVKYGNEIAYLTPARMKCGNERCGCSQYEVSHHLYWYG